MATLMLVPLKSFRWTKILLCCHSLWHY